MLKYIRLTFLMIMISLASPVFGQFSIGAFAGLNSSKLKGDAPDKAKYKTLMGANVGLVLDLNLNKTLVLSLQPSYSQEGTKLSYTLPGYEEPIDSASVRLNYFSLPLLLKVQSTNQRFYALAGIETGFLMDSFVKSHDEKEDLNVDIAQVNVAIQFGAGYRIPIKQSLLFIELRYTQGLVNLTDDLGDNTYIPRVKTTGLKIFVGYEIPLTRSKN